MVCKGTLKKMAVSRYWGAYAAPPGPDWGWRTLIESDSDSTWRLSMFNISPDGQAYPAVEVNYKLTNG
jgi:hypothetical protein